MSAPVSAHAVAAVLSLSAFVAAGLAGSTAAGDEPRIDFARDIRPILSDNCYACHGPDEEQRAVGLRLDTEEGAKGETASGAIAIVAGSLDDSELVWRILTDDESERMPPPDSGKSLEAEEIELLERWVSEGAVWALHWSFVPPARTAPPAVARSEWGRNPIDAFVLSRLTEEGLQPSLEAPRGTLLRRATLDLTGLPPTLSELDAFLADDTPGAYERTVDRLLASPRYGEHMARFWLDAARYGDTHGLHLDNERIMWPWRDWVIDALNANLPYDQFVVQQLAGDMVANATLETRIASGFNRCNVTSAEGGMIAEEYLAKYAMDRADTTAAVFMGLTMGCAQCHDHKFDPITQRDYYRMFGFFNSIAEEASDRNTQTPGPLLAAPGPGEREQLAAADEKIRAAAEQLAAPNPSVDAAQQVWQREAGERLARHFRPLTPSEATSSGGATMTIQEDGSVLVHGENPAKDAQEFVLHTDATNITGLYLDALLPEGAKLPGRAVNQNFVLSKVTLDVTELGRGETSGPSGGAPHEIELERAEASFSQEKFDVLGTLDDDPNTGWGALGREGPRTALFVPVRPFGSAGGSELRVRLTYDSVHAAHVIGRVRFAITTDPALAPSALGTWSSAGPFQGTDRGDAFSRAFVPETGTDVEDGAAWTEQPTYTDAKIHLFEGDNSAIYLRRTITSVSPRTMRISLGSDDAIKVWLNGAIVLDKDVARGVAPDQDFVNLGLRAGDNELLLKVVNFGGGFGYYFRVVSESGIGVPLDLLRPLATGDAAALTDTSLRDFYRRNYSEEWRELETEHKALQAERAKIDAAIPRTMVSRELEQRRQAHILARGQYDQKGEPVEPGTPASLPPMPLGSPPTRLGLAQWLVSYDHPLTARVAVNRYWQRFLGIGLVKTAEDFGSQGEFPSHPELLDWLAIEFRDSMWDVKAMHRLIVTSATYRQSARVTPELVTRDPENRLYARGARYRLDAERIRDQALFLSGLLVEKIGGQSVKPYQPMGIWKAVGYSGSNTVSFKQDQGEALWRRSLYTFWKRTAPPPTMAMFDAPSREGCTLRRPRTNTPLQALVLLNDPQFVEAARHLGVRIVLEGGSTDEERIGTLFRMATSRAPTEREQGLLIDVLARARAAYADDAAGATALISTGDSPPSEGADPRELAAWATLATLVLNLDETITKG